MWKHRGPNYKTRPLLEMGPLPHELDATDPNLTSITLPCEHCGGPFLPVGSVNQKYCSKRCRLAAQEQRHAARHHERVVANVARSQRRHH